MERIYCSDLAREADARLYGSAVQVEVWLLLEYPRPWKPKALEDNDLPTDVNRHLAELPLLMAEAGVKLRIQFVKQAASAGIECPRAFIADGRAAHLQLTEGRFEDYQGFGAITADDLLAARLPGARVVDEEILLVCTNGQRDLCCARFGLPLYEALAFEYGQRVWQTTHVGGHRYAPNLICLPSGLVYGHVAPEAGVALVQNHDRGEVALDKLRGRAGFNPAAQAAEYFIRTELGASTGHLEIIADDDTWAWSVGDQAGTIRIREEKAGMIVASCGAEPKQEFAHHVEEFSIHT